MKVGHIGDDGDLRARGLRRAERAGRRAARHAHDLFMRYQVKMKAMGQGSMIVIHPAAGKINTRTTWSRPTSGSRQLLFLDLLEQGVFIAERGFMALSVMVTDADCERVAGAVERHINGGGNSGLGRVTPRLYVIPAGRIAWQPGIRTRPGGTERGWVNACPCV